MGNLNQAALFLWTKFELEVNFNKFKLEIIHKKKVKEKVTRVLFFNIQINKLEI